VRDRTNPLGRSRETFASRCRRWRLERRPRGVLSSPSPRAARVPTTRHVRRINTTVNTHFAAAHVVWCMVGECVYVLGRAGDDAESICSPLIRRKCSQPRRNNSAGNKYSICLQPDCALSLSLSPLSEK
jgi:hypothetical protein